MVRSRSIGGKKAARKRRRSLKKITREAVRASMPGVVESGCALCSDHKVPTVIQTLTRRECERYQDGAPFVEKDCASSWYGSMIPDLEILWRRWLESKLTGADPNDTFPVHLFAPAASSPHMIREFRYVRFK